MYIDLCLSVCPHAWCCLSAGPSITIGNFCTPNSLASPNGFDSYISVIHQRKLWQEVVPSVFEVCLKCTLTLWAMELFNRIMEPLRVWGWKKPLRSSVAAELRLCSALYSAGSNHRASGSWMWRSLCSVAMAWSVDSGSLFTYDMTHVIMNGSVLLLSSCCVVAVSMEVGNHRTPA